jgi:hypothetical protein
MVIITNQKGTYTVCVDRLEDPSGFFVDKTFWVGANKANRRIFAIISKKIAWQLTMRRVSQCVTNL